VVVVPPVRWWSRPGTRVALLTVIMAVASAGVVLSLAGHRRLFALHGPGWLAVLAAGFALTEGFTLHLRVRRGAHGVNLSELPMVLGVLAFDPVAVIVIRALAGGVGLFALRRQRAGKLAFNVALLAVQAGVAVLVFRAIAGPSDGSRAGGLGLRDWLAVYPAMLCSDAAAAVLVTAVIAMHENSGEWRRLPASLRGSWLVAITTTVALLAFTAAVDHPWVLALVPVLGVLLYLAYRAYMQNGYDNAEVEQLYQFTRDLDRIAELDVLVAVVLDRMRDLLRVTTAEFQIPQAGSGLVRVRRLAGRSAEVVTETIPAAQCWPGPTRAGEPVLEPERLAVPVALDGEPATFTVIGTLEDVGTFSTARLRLFQALANHAGAAIGRSVLVDRLHREAADKVRASLHDPLSGLPNRRRFHDLLDIALSEARAAGAGVAVMVLDLDRFKEINDALGHETGDRLLREVGERLRGHLAGRGVVARLGGDEFAAFVPTDGTPEAAVAEATELGALLDRPIRMDPLTLTARASIGVAAAPRHGDDAPALVRHADVAMYAAKESRSCVRLYDPASDVNSPQRLALIADLRDAVERRELVVAYQPKVDPRTGQVTGAEALARWHHPLRGPVPPDEFIPLAEHSGLIRPLTLHVLELALRRRAAWARAGHHLHVAVNLSPNSLVDAELPEIVARLLTETGNPPGMLTLEITESTLLADPVGSMATLERLHALGVKLSIDDFGTGYSSLGRLRELPIDEVKIDKSFVQRMAEDHRDRAVVRSAVQLGHALDLTVVAEGVEDTETYDYLAREGCDVVQGYLLSRPLPPEEFETWLETRRELLSRNVTHTFG
jgi:diguanylate cyclase (GGDEF)-like protein